MTAPSTPAVIVDVVASTPLVRIVNPTGVEDLGAHILEQFAMHFPSVVHPAVRDASQTR